MIFGSAVHTYLLEKDKFGEQYTVMEKIDRRTKDGKEAYANLLAMSAGKQLISSETFEQLVSIEKSLSKDTEALALLSNGLVEQSIYWNDPDTGVLCKVRPDIIHSNMVIDLKTTSDGSYRAFQLSAFKYGYDIQMAMIHEAFKHGLNKEMKDFVFVAIEKESPHAIACYPVDESFIDEAILDFKALLRKYKECLNKNEWPSYEKRMLTRPGFAKYEVIE
jgi:hypothetical protein